jgi:Bax protein
MQSSIWPALERGRYYAFPAVWAAVFATGVGFSQQPLPSLDVAPYLSFAPLGKASAAVLDPVAFLALNAEPESLTFVRHEVSEPDDTFHSPARDFSFGHGRFAAPGNALRRQVQLRPVNPRTADELAGFFRDVAYSLTDIRLGEAVPPIRVERVPADLVNKDGNERKALFITAILPVVLDVNQRVLAEREQLLYLRDKMAMAPMSISPIERIWLEDLADRYEASVNDIDELVRRVDIVPPSMAIAQGGVESGWGTSPAARSTNALFGQIRAGSPQPFTNVAQATDAYITNLNTHRAYAAFRVARAALREQGEPLDGYRLVGSLLRYSEMGQDYVKFVRQIMRENDLSDFDKARLSSF